MGLKNTIHKQKLSSATKYSILYLPYAGDNSEQTSGFNGTSVIVGPTSKVYILKTKKVHGFQLLICENTILPYFCFVFEIIDLWAILLLLWLKQK